MSDVLQFTLQTYTANQLAIKVTNKSGAQLDQSLMIELYPVAFLLDQRIIDAAKAAATRVDPPGLAPLAGVVSAAQGWSVWARGEVSNSSVVIMLANDLDERCHDMPPVKMDPGAEFIINIPLNPQAERDTADLLFSYDYGTDPRVDGKLELKSADTVDWNPDVTLTTDHKSPTAIDPKDSVKIFWHIKDGVSATLRGPLPGGSTEWPLSDSTPKYRMSDGSFEIKAVGPMTYVLQAEVKRKGRPNVQVVRMLSLDIYTAAKNGYLAVRPQRVLPYGLVEIDWAAWGIDYATIEAPGGIRKLILTEKTLSGFYQGVGVMRDTAAKPEQQTEYFARLIIEVDKKRNVADKASFTVVPWRAMAKSTFTGQPIGLAVAAPHLALLTTEGLWIADVGVDDFSGTTPYNLVTTLDLKQTERWTGGLALAASGKNFFVLRETPNTVQVARYTSAGTLGGVPVDLPNEMRGAGSFCDLAVYGGRVYVVLEPRSTAPRRAFSVSFDSTPGVREEPILEHLAGHRLMTFDNALYALNRDTGAMFRFRLREGKLEPFKAASAVDQSAGLQASSMVKQGLLVPVGRVLAIFGPTSVPSLNALAGYGLQNVLRYQNVTPPRVTGPIPQDLVYNPQQDRWLRCGHGLDITTGVVGYRGGDSPRLWSIDANGNTHTLTLGSEDLFMPDFITDGASKPLTPFLNKKRVVRILNDTNMQFVPVNQTCFNAGLTALSATSPVEITPPVINLGPGAQAEFELSYNEAASPTTTLRFLLQRPPGIKNEYFLEVTLSGPNLSTATSVFKRLDPARRYAVAEVPGTRQQDSADRTIVVFPKPLIDGIALTLRNASPYPIWVRRPNATTESDRETLYKGDKIIINHSTTPFSIYAHGAGELFFDVDFAMPDGVQETFENETQTTRIRVDGRKTEGLRIDSASINPSDRSTIYECTVRYKIERALTGVYLGDGVPNKDGSAFYVPVGTATGPTHAQLFKIDANNLFITANTVLWENSGVFFAPNSLAVLSDKVLALLNGFLFVYDQGLKQIERIPMWWHKVVTNLKADPSDVKFFTLGMEESSGPFKYSYSFWSRSFGPRMEDVIISLDLQKGFRPSRVPGGPAWVAPTTLSPMDVSRNQTVALCVEGGLFLIDVQTKKVTEVGLDGTGREEAIMIDTTSPFVFSAHARPDNNALMVSRVNRTNPNEKLTTTLPSGIVNMATDTNPPTTQNLQYKPQHAVSFATTTDALYVSHGTKIYILDKQTLAQRQNFAMDKPCRLIQVRQGKPPGGDSRYGVPKDCYLVYAIGATYTGDGKTARDYKTSVYKIGIMH